MTEAEWLVCNDPQLLLETVEVRATERKLRLFACGYCRITWRHITDRHIKGLVRLTEQLAETPESEMELQATWQAQFAKSFLCGGRTAYTSTAAYSSIVRRACLPEALSPRQRERACNLIRELVGPLFFRFVRLRPSWLAWNDGTVKKIAQAIYGERRFQYMPILGDALEDSGCDDVEMLSHCRSEGPHVRGCWVVDLILGKE